VSLTRPRCATLSRWRSLASLLEKTATTLQWPSLLAPILSGRKNAAKSLVTSEDEEARWYTAHREDWHKYVDMDDAEVVGPDSTADRSRMTQVVSLRLPRRLLTGLRRVAEQREISYQLLIERWLSDRLAQETAAPDSRRSSGRRNRAAL